MKKKIALSRTRIKLGLKNKTNPELVNIIDLARRNKAWLPVAKALSGPTRNYAGYNLRDLNEKVSAGDTAIVIGKVLSSGDLDKKVKLCALSFSKSTLDKLKKSKVEFCTILDEIKKNPEAKGVKIIK